MTTRRQPKWGHLSSIDYSTRVGTNAWFAAHPSAKIRKLSAYRWMHAIGGGHTQVREYARAIHRDPSSSMTLRQMLNAPKYRKQ